MTPAASTSNAHTAAQGSIDNLLGGLTVAGFLTRYWHKDAALVREAVRGAEQLLDAKTLFSLAQRDDVESRLVVRHGKSWALTHGPFRPRDFRALPERDWTLLVQGVNLHSDRADALLRRFSFLPFARLDDLMVSYAAPGGGVGPHFDSYDVFLLQGIGRRRWRFGRQADLGLKKNLPLKILARFEPQREEVLASGDMLYLPPQMAHDGIAVNACTTYSIGLRAPSFNDLAQAFLDFLHDEIDLPGRYADPDLAPTRHPARIGRSMQRHCAQALSAIEWSDTTVQRFLGCWLSEPKPSVFFERPDPALSLLRFLRHSAKHGLRLNARTQLLYDARHLFVNGIALPWPADGAAALRRLADRRTLSARDAAALPDNVMALLHDWYRDGFLSTAEA